MSSESTVTYQGKSEKGVHTFTVEDGSGKYVVVAAKDSGLRCECDRPACSHVAAAKTFWQARASGGNEQAAENTTRPGNGEEAGSPPAGAQPQGTEPPAPLAECDLRHLHHLLGALVAYALRMADALDRIALASAPAAPGYVRPMADYAAFDWGSIGATVKEQDAHGPTSLEWGGYLWTRRSPQNKFGEAIWFSRPDGKDADGNPRYGRLITFKAPAEASPLPQKVAAKVKENGR